MRSDSGNLDRSISESLALKRLMKYGQRKEQEDEKDKKKSLDKF
jgi:transposase